VTSATFALVLARTAGLTLAAPALGDRSLPWTVKAAIALSLAAVFAPIVAVPAAPSGWGLALALAGEAAVGCALGFGATFVFAGVRAGGSLIDQQMGISMAGVLDPFSGEEETPIARLHLLLALALYVAADGHHRLVTGLMESFRSVPPLGLADAGMAQGLLALAGGMFSVALQVAAPAVLALLIAGAAIAVVGRTSPEVDCFAGGFPVRFVLGLAVVSAGLAAVGGLL
jgi:flagellar biosynthetic protein FliR